MLANARTIEQMLLNAYITSCTQHMPVTLTPTLTCLKCFLHLSHCNSCLCSCLTLLTSTLSLTLTCLACLSHTHLAPFNLMSTLMCHAFVLHACLVPYNENETQHHLLRQPLSLVLHVCHIFHLAPFNLMPHAYSLCHIFVLNACVALYSQPQHQLLLGLHVCCTFFLHV